MTIESFAIDLVLSDPEVFATADFALFTSTETPDITVPTAAGVYCFEGWEDDGVAARAFFDEQRNEAGVLEPPAEPIETWLAPQAGRERSALGVLKCRYVGEAQDLKTRIEDYWYCFHNVATQRVSKAEAAGLLGVSRRGLEGLIIRDGLLKVHRGAGTRSRVAIRGIDLLKLGQTDSILALLGSERPQVCPDDADPVQTRRIAYELASFLAGDADAMTASTGDDRSSSRRTISLTYVMSSTVTIDGDVHEASMARADVRLLVENLLLVSRPWSPGLGVTHRTLNQGMNACGDPPSF